MLKRALLPVAAALAVAGCGGASEDEFRADANDACGSTRSRVLAIGALWGESRRTQADRAIELAGRISELRGDLDELEVPDDLADEVDSYDGLLGEQERSLEEVNELTAPPVRVEANLGAIDNGAGDAARGLGLDGCGDLDMTLQDAVRRPAS